MNKKRKEYTYREYEECMISLYKDAVEDGDLEHCEDLQERIYHLIETYPIYHNAEVAEMLKNDLKLGYDAGEYTNQGETDIFDAIRRAAEARLSNKLYELYS